MSGGWTRRLQSCLSFARSYSSTQCRLQSSTVLTGDQLGPIHQDKHQSFRVCKDGKPLPLPPVLDPVVLFERSRWEQTKAKPNVEKFTAFQKKLWENPYAHALASPVRECRSTNLLLPSTLLLSLHPCEHPETSDPWLVPVSLTTSAKHLGTPYRFLGRKAVVEELGKKYAWRKGIYSRFNQKLGNKVSKIVWREDMPELILSLLRKKLLDKLKWYFRRKGHLVPCQSPRREDVEALEGVSCVIYFGTLKTRADELQTQTKQIANEVEDLAKGYAESLKARLDPHKAQHVTHHPPTWWKGPLVPHLQYRARFPLLEFKTTDWRGSKVAVYSLYDLLGEDGLGELLKGSNFENKRCVVIRRGRHNVPVELLFMQLQAFLAVPGP